MTNTKKHKDGNAYMDPTHREKGSFILNGKNFFLVYSLTLPFRIYVSSKQYWNHTSRKNTIKI